MHYLQSILMVLLIVTAIFLIVLVLIQRGKGGGLAGALGGMGGQSAFGTKAGDLFTKVTVGVAAFWIILCCVTVKMLSGASVGPLNTGLGGETKPGATAPASTEKPGPGDQSRPAAPAPGK
jgi:preprotein translocase subunit SecG